MTLIAPSQSAALAAILLGLAWLGFWIDRKPIASRIPGVPWVIACGLLLSNTGVIPNDAPAYGLVGQYLLPLGVACLLFKANLRAIFSLSGWVLAAFAVASVGLCIGAIVGFYLFDLGAIGPKVAATYAGAFIGGVVNFVAISEAVGMTPTEFSVSLGASAPVSVLGLLALVSLPSIPWIRKRIPSRIIDESTAPSAGGADDDTPRFRLDHVAATLAIGLAVCAVTEWICTQFDLGTYRLFVVTLIVVVLANALPKFFAGLQGDFQVGMLCMYAFFAMIGAGTDAISFIRSAPVLFLFCAFVIGTHFVVLLLLARIFKWDLAEVVIGSAAAIVGPAAGAGIASAKGWRSLITPAISVGILGYVVANPIGLAIFRLLN